MGPSRKRQWAGQEMEVASVIVVNVIHIQAVLLLYN